MTNQELFDRVVEHAAQMRRFAVNADGPCYHGPNGCCFIGSLIPAEMYQPELEGTGADDGDVLEAAGLEQEQADLAVDLQNVHDDRSRNASTDELRRICS